MVFCNTALAHFLPVVISSAIGYGAAAWLTPVATNRMSNAAWVTAMLALGGVVFVMWDGEGIGLSVGLLYAFVSAVAIALASAMLGAALLVLLILRSILDALLAFRRELGLVRHQNETFGLRAPRLYLSADGLVDLTCLARRTRHSWRRG